MVNLQKSGDSAVKFVFTDSDHYLYGNGEIEVPVNSLLLVIDESDMVTFKKLSGDPFLSFRADNSNLGTKEAIEQFYKENMVGSTGGGGSESGITSGEVQTMIDNSLEDYYTDDEVDAALSGKASISDVTAVANDVQTVSGQVQTKVAITDFNAYSAATATALNGKVDTSALNNYYTKTEVYNKQEVDAAYGTAYQALTAHTADTTVHVTSAEKTTWNNKSDFSGDYNDLTNKPTIPTVPTNISDFTNDAGYITSADITGKADTTAVTAVNNVLTAHTSNTTVHVSQAEKDIWNAKVDTSAITTAITSGSTDAEIPTAKAVYDATQSGGGGMDDDTQQLISTAFNDLNDRKADLTELSKYQKKGDYVVTSTLADYMTNDAFDEYATAKERIISGALNDLNDKFGGLRLVKISQADYDNLATKDENTLFIINNVI